MPLMWQNLDFRQSHSTQNVVPKNCFVVLRVSSRVKLAAYGHFRFLKMGFLTTRDHLIFSPSPFTLFSHPRFIVKSPKKPKSNTVYDHTKLKTPYPVRFAKLSSFRRCQY